jgi:type II secretory pathway pseudopilin PulG
MRACVARPALHLAVNVATPDDQQSSVTRFDRFPPSAGGFTYLWVLLAIGLVAAGLAATAEVASTAARRDKEAELLFAGDQFARAIARYRASVPGSQQYPQRLQDLLADNRFPNVRRHLRRIYRDPMTGSTEWGLVRGPNGGIIGVYSTSTALPLKTANFPKEYAAFAGAAAYRDWVFAPSGGAAGAVVGSRADGSSISVGPSNPGTAPPQQAPAVRVPREPSACNAQRANDLRSCEGTVGSKGDQALEACRQSATRRFSDCLSGGNAEPLAVN